MNRAPLAGHERIPLRGTAAGLALVLCLTAAFVSLCGTAAGPPAGGSPPAADTSAPSDPPAPPRRGAQMADKPTVEPARGRTVSKSAVDRFTQCYYYPAKDAHQGTLYPAAARLLDLVRQKMPLLAADVATMPSPPPPAPQAPPTPAPPPPPPEESWVRVMINSVVDDEQLAYSYAMGGSYPKAAEMYRRLLKDKPDDAHLRLLLALCERNMGDVQKAQTDLAEAARKNANLAPWNAWMTEIISLSSIPKETAP